MVPCGTIEKVVTEKWDKYELRQLVPGDDDIIQKWKEHFYDHYTKIIYMDQRIFMVMRRKFATRRHRTFLYKKMENNCENVQNNKSPVFDNIAAEMFKYGGRKLIEMK